MQWFTSDQIPDRADIINGRGYIKPPLEGTACTTQQTATEEHRYTRVYIKDNALVADNEPAFNIPLTEKVTWVDACYDQVNRLNCAWIEAGVLKHYWYDPILPGFTITERGLSDRCFLFMDDVRFFANITSKGSNIRLLYERDGILRQLEQSDRYQTETDIVELRMDEHIAGVGMNSKYRLQLVLQRETISDAVSGEPDEIYLIQVDDTDVMVDNSIVVYED